MPLKVGSLDTYALHGFRATSLEPLMADRDRYIVNKDECKDCPPGRAMVWVQLAGLLFTMLFSSSAGNCRV